MSQFEFYLQLQKIEKGTKNDRDDRVAQDKGGSRHGKI